MAHDNPHAHHNISPLIMRALRDTDYSVDLVPEDALAYVYAVRDAEGNRVGKIYVCNRATNLMIHDSDIRALESHLRLAALPRAEYRASGGFCELGSTVALRKHGVRRGYMHAIGHFALALLVQEAGE